mmetsp:Transcript_12811/g.33912  ORF Transcript_12811/g.33912 Transcript_12811/m.33912 type:complete len:212 (-) Transcript_12811:552-1187(-)
MSLAPSHSPHLQALMELLTTPAAPLASAASNADLIAALRRARTLTSPAVERAFRLCPRADFVGGAGRDHAYANAPLRLPALGFNVSAPSVYTEALQGLEVREGERVLDVGSGCGLLTAMAAVMVGRGGCVVGCDLVDETVGFARGNVARLREQSAEFAAGAGAVEFVKENVILMDLDAALPPAARAHARGSGGGGGGGGEEGGAPAEERGG